jgi:hypothetical protein
VCFGFAAGRLISCRDEHSKGVQKERQSKGKRLGGRRRFLAHRRRRNRLGMLAGLRHFGEEFFGDWSMFSGEIKRETREEPEGYL